MVERLALKGKFITFEGPEGSGKSTHSKWLGRYLRQCGYRAVWTREPGGTAVGEKIRKILLNKHNKDINPLCEVLLYMASRTQIVNHVIIPELKEGKVVICDRFQDATICYQGYGGGVDVSLIEFIGRSITRGVKPDLTIYLDIDVKKGLERTGRIKLLDRMERKSFSFHKRVRRGYLELASAEPERIRVVCAMKSISEVREEIRRIVGEKLKIRNPIICL